MNHRLRAGGLIYGAVSAILCTGITVGGVRWAISEAQEPLLPVPAVTAPVLAIPEAPAIAAADLWIDDRSRIDTPLLKVPLAAETQWAIFEQCGQDADLFCSVMAIAEVESDFDANLLGDGGDSIGMMQINTRWHTGRMEALGVTDLTDPVQCAAVAIDYLLELEGILEAGPGDQGLYVGYNAGPSRAKRTSSTAYSREVMAVYQEYIEEMEETE
jgi:aryl carrier-like protein